MFALVESHHTPLLVSTFPLDLTDAIGIFELVELLLIPTCSGDRTEISDTDMELGPSSALPRKPVGNYPNPVSSDDFAQSEA